MEEKKMFDASMDEEMVDAENYDSGLDEMVDIDTDIIGDIDRDVYKMFPSKSKKTSERDQGLLPSQLEEHTQTSNNNDTIFQVMAPEDDPLEMSSAGSSMSLGSSLIHSDEEEMYKDDAAFWREFREKATGKKDGYSSDSDSDGASSQGDTPAGIGENSTISSRRRKLLSFKKRVRNREESMVYDYTEAFFALGLWTLLAFVFLQISGRPDWLMLIYQREIMCISIPVTVIIVLFLVELYHDSREWNRGGWRIRGEPQTSEQEPKTPEPEVFRPF